jgi:signal transduction histidine kinase
VAAAGREVAASRRRLVEAADEEQRRLGDELHAGAEHRLAAIADRLAVLDGPVAAGLATGVAEARAELRAFAHGIRPRTLTEHGLGAALAELASRAAPPVALHADAPRCAPSHEAAAYFVCSEALANVAKYAAATHVEITVARVGDRLRVAVADDGVGGADAALGSGLRGLADRVEALGGALRVDSRPGRGTRLEAELPFEPERPPKEIGAAA